MKPGSSWRRHPVLFAAAFLILVIAGTVWLLVGGSRGVEIAAVLALTVPTVALYAQLFGVPWQTSSPDQAELAAAAQELARKVGDSERAEQNLFLADSGQGNPANVSFARPEQLSWPAELVIWRSDGGRQSGSLADIAEFYGGSDTHPGLDHGRLIILGEAGAGKTVLANQLLLDLLSRASPAGAQKRVPVRLSLPAFDPGTDAEQIDSGIIAARLDAWIVSHLVGVFGASPRAASLLVQRNWILPVLDGLDEMDPGAGDPARAAAVLRALNYPAGGGIRPVIVTCRNDRYRQLTMAKTQPGQERFLQDSTAIELEPLNPKQLADFLIKRFDNPADHGRIQSRWQPVLDRLKAEPEGPLAATLSSPLRLYMALTAYHQPDTHPVELTKLTADAIGPHLMNCLIPAVVGQHPKPGGGNYDQADVAQWLTTLARHLRACQIRESGSGSDINLHELWTAAGNRLPRYTAATLYMLLIAPPILAFAVLGIHRNGSLINESTFNQIGSGIFFLALPVSIFWLSSRMSVMLDRLDLASLRTRNGLRRLALTCRNAIALGFLIGFLGGIGNLLSRGSRSSFEYTLALSIMGGLAFGLLYGIRYRPTAISHPRQLVTQGITRDLITVLVSGLAFGLAVISISVISTKHNPFVGGNLSQLALAVTAGVILGLSLCTKSPWLRYFVATRILAHRRELPSHPAIFLDWAYAAGLMRLAGIAIQFRHRELQDQLATIPFSDELHACKECTDNSPWQADCLPLQPHEAGKSQSTIVVLHRG